MLTFERKLIKRTNEEGRPKVQIGREIAYMPMVTKYTLHVHIQVMFTQHIFNNYTTVRSTCIHLPVYL